jgi:transposase
MRELFEQLVALDERIGRADCMLQRVFAGNAQYQKLAQVEGIGPMAATALVAAVDNANEFTNGRHLAAW